MVQLPAIVSAVVAILGLAGVAAGAAAVFRTSSFRTTINDQKEVIGALRERVEVAEEGEKRANTRCDILEEEVADLRRTKEILATEVTGAVKITEIAAGLLDLARVSQERHAELVQLLGQR